MQDVLLACNKIFSIKLETIYKQLEVVALASNELMCDFCEQPLTLGVFLSLSLRLSGEHIKYMGLFMIQQRNLYQGYENWLNQSTNPLEKSKRKDGGNTISNPLEIFFFEVSFTSKKSSLFSLSKLPNPPLPFHPFFTSSIINKLSLACMHKKFILYHIGSL